jgi:hypothetical protein
MIQAFTSPNPKLALAIIVGLMFIVFKRTLEGSISALISG